MLKLKEQRVEKDIQVEMRKSNHSDAITIYYDDVYVAYVDPLLGDIELISLNGAEAERLTNKGVRVSAEKSGHMTIIINGFAGL